MQALLHARGVRHAEPCRVECVVVDEVATAAQLVGDTPMAVAGKLVLDALDESHPCGSLRTSPARLQDAPGGAEPSAWVSSTRGGAERGDGQPVRA